MTDAILSLGALHVGQRLRGLVPGQVVTVVAVDPIDDGLVEVFYRDESGQSGAHMVTGADTAALTEVSAEDSAPAFDADPDEFRLVAETQRIKYAALYDPMAAVNSSDVDPLPHQIRAVYEELLPRVPLRFLLADDPGAGKTIMAGLYIKELILRSDCEGPSSSPPVVWWSSGVRNWPRSSTCGSRCSTTTWSTTPRAATSSPSTICSSCGWTRSPAARS